MLLKKVKEFKINHHYKFLWTRQGKVFLKKNESQSQIAIVSHRWKSLKPLKPNITEIMKAKRYLRWAMLIQISV